MNRGMLLLPILFALGGCASLDAWTKGVGLGAFHRGRVVFNEKCSSCHSMYARRLAMPGGPTALDEIARRYSDRGLDREIEVISTFGHYAMPAVPVDPEDRRDLVAYIGGFR